MSRSSRGSSGSSLSGSQLAIRYAYTISYSWPLTDVSFGAAGAVTMTLTSNKEPSKPPVGLWEVARQY